MSRHASLHMMYDGVLHEVFIVNVKNHVTVSAVLVYGVRHSYAQNHSFHQESNTEEIQQHLKEQRKQKKPSDVYLFAMNIFVICKDGERPACMGTFHHEYVNDTNDY